MRARGQLSLAGGLGAALVVLAFWSCAHAQAGFAKQSASVNQNQAGASPDRVANFNSKDTADEELKKGTELTSRASFAEAIPHLLAARGRGANEYAVNFNLALCYLGTSQFKQAIDVLNGLRNRGHDGADLENVLAQAYVGNTQSSEALASLQKAASFSPLDEKLFLFVADACMDQRNYILGFKIVGMGLRNLPQSARLHYERAMFLTQLDELDQAKQDFEAVGRLAPGSMVGYLAAAHQELLAGDIPEAITTAREGMKKGYDDHALLTVLGEALIRSGASSGQADFSEARTVLEKAVAQQPNDGASQIALGSIYLSAGELKDAIVHLEQARQLEPGAQAVYANLAKAYQRSGEMKQASVALAILQKLNQEQAERISSAPGDHKPGYASHGIEEEDAPPQP